MDRLTLFGCHGRGWYPYSLLGFVIFFAAHMSGCVKAIAQEDQQLFRGTEAKFLAGVDFFDVALEMSLCRLRLGTQLQHERASLHVATLRRLRPLRRESPVQLP